jgi:hypothetical protein
MIQMHYIVISILFISSITTLLIGTIKEIQPCIIGGVVSILGSAMISMGIMIHKSYTIKTTKPVAKPPPQTNIINPIYETV